MVRFSNGFYSFSDSYFKSMRKQDLINYIRTIEKNWENQLITNDIQYNNCMKLLAEERNKAIDECYMKAKTMMEELAYQNQGRRNGKTHRVYCIQALEFLRQVAEQMKGEKA